MKAQQEAKESKTLQHEGCNIHDFGLESEEKHGKSTIGLLNLCVVLCLLFSCGYKESYIAYTKAIPNIPVQNTLQVTVDKVTGSPIVTYTDPRDRVTLKPPEHHPIYQVFANVIESATKIWAIVEIGKTVQSIANRPESTNVSKEVYVDKQSTTNISDKDYKSVADYQTNNQTNLSTQVQDYRDSGTYIDTSNETNTTNTDKLIDSGNNVQRP